LLAGSALLRLTILGARAARLFSELLLLALWLTLLSL
jgi:hypothetical protein